MLSYDFRVDRVYEKVRIAGGMNVALRAIECGGDFKQLNTVGTFHVTWPASEFRITRLVEQGRKPANFQFSAAFEKHVRAIELNDEARLGIDEVRIFGRLCERREINMVAADFFRDRGNVRRGCDDIQFRKRRPCEGREGKQT